MKKSKNNLWTLLGLIIILLIVVLLFSILLFSAKRSPNHIMSGLHDGLHSSYPSAEGQNKKGKAVDAHQQALEILRQDNALEDKQLSVVSSAPKGKEEFYLPGLPAIKGVKGQSQISIK